MFSARSVPRCFNQDQFGSWKPSHAGNFPRCTPVRDLHTALNPPYVYDYVTKLCRRQAEAIQNHENEHVRVIAQGEARYGEYKRLNLSDGQNYDGSSD
jgi:hypothetical protein